MVISTSIAYAAEQGVDDGAGQLTTEYSAEQIQGEKALEIFAAVNKTPRGRPVRLGPAGSITVNGVQLEGKQDSRGHYYRATIPSADSLSIVMVRSADQRDSIVLSMPVLELGELPRKYRPYETLAVPIKYSAPPSHVKDVLTMPIGRTFFLDSRLWDPIAYKLAAVPNISDGSVLFDPITKTAPTPGIYKAAIYRQQRVILDKVSAGVSGWATLTTTRQFEIAVE